MHCHIYSARANVCGVFSIGTTPVLDPHEDLKSLRKSLCSMLNSTPRKDEAESFNPAAKKGRNASSLHPSETRSMPIEYHLRDRSPCPIIL